MYRKPLLILAIAAACASAQAQQTSSPAKKELVARILKIQQPSIDTMAQLLVQQSLGPLLEQVDNAVQRVPTEKREAVTKGIQADIRKYIDETVPLVRDRANKLAPTTVGPILEEKFTEDELKQVVAMLESPVLSKFQAAGGDIQRALTQKVVAETQPQVEKRFQTLEDSIGKRLGLPAPAAGSSSGGGKPATKK